MTVQEMLEIAVRYVTDMADAMVQACLAWSLATGTPLDIPERDAPPPIVRHPPVPAAHAEEDPDWERMVRLNADVDPRRQRRRRRR